MTAPAGILKKTKNNDNKNFRAREEWQKGKRLGRPKQVFVNTGLLTADEVLSLIDWKSSNHLKIEWQKVST
jgi:hypothetical protein